MQVNVQTTHRFDLYGTSGVWQGTVRIALTLPGETLSSLKQRAIDAFAAELRSVGAAPVTIAAVEHVAEVFSSLEDRSSPGPRPPIGTS